MTHPVDVAVGRRIRFRRWMIGLTQQQLAAEAGITFQQLQKYERGANRVSASRLFELALALKVPIGFFFKDLEEDGVRLEDIILTKEACELLKAYHTLPEAVRSHFMGIAMSMTAGTEIE